MSAVTRPVPHVPGRALDLRAVSRILASSLAIAILVLGVWALTAPTGANGSTASVRLAACAANARTRPSTSARVRRVIASGVRMTVVATVTGSRYTTTCAGKTVRSTSWARVSGIAGRSVRSLYGVTYLYVASTLLRPPVTSVTRYARCSVNLRSTPSSAGTIKATITVGKAVTVIGTLTGTAYNTSCAGSVVSSTSWARITAIGGTSVQTTYGVPYLYAAAGLLGATAPVAPTPSPTPTPPDTGTDPSTMLQGVDVSHWQNAIDWTQVAAAGKKFAFIKASESTDFVDPLYATNRAAAKAAGLKVGAYHFAQPSTTAGDGVAEADHFIDVAGPVSGELPPVLDLEVSNGLSTADMQAWTRAFMDEVVRRTGVHGVIYVSPSFWRNYLGDTTWFADNGYVVLWIAHWTSADLPTLPANNWSNEGWTFWQYTSSGTVPGITGRVDLDRFNGTDLRPYLIP